MNPTDLHQYLLYDPLTGELRWRERGNPRWDKRYSGQIAGSLDPRGYIAIGFKSGRLWAHRVAWAMTHGEWPEMIDHINGDKSDNRLVNLRAVTRSENQRNAKSYETNKSGYPGVFFWSERGCWRVHIGARGYVGIYPTYEEAVAARQAAERAAGYHSNHGRAQ